MIHIHCKADREAAQAFFDTFGNWIDLPERGKGFGVHEKLQTRWPAGQLYTCVCGPGGLVRGVMHEGVRVA